MQLSKRLAAVANLITPGNRVADVGTDHGYIPIYLLNTKKSPHVIAMDINEGPLKRAKENIANHQLEKNIEIRLSDGLHALAPNEVDTVVIAGMGGNLVMRILSEGAAVLKTVEELILQPQSEIAKVRHFLQEQGYEIVCEEMVCEDEKFYPMMRVVLGKMAMTKEIEFIYGPRLLKEKNLVLKQYLTKERQTFASILEKLKQSKSDNVDERVAEIEQEMRQNALAREAYENK